MPSSTRKSKVKQTSTTSTRTPAPVRESMVHSARSIKNYTFEYQRDRVSRQAGSSYFRLESNGDGQEIEMTLQEAQSLYNFLGNALNR